MKPFHRYSVTVSRAVYQTTTVEIQAEDRRTAERLAEETTTATPERFTWSGEGNRHDIAYEPEVTRSVELPD